MVRAKFKCAAKDGDENVGFNVRFEAVTESEENKQWSKHTPWGELRIAVSNVNAANAFEVGKEYYLDLSLISERHGGL